MSFCAGKRRPCNGYFEDGKPRPKHLVPKGPKKGRRNLKFVLKFDDI
jgi:hypothetical protein